VATTEFFSQVTGLNDHLAQDEVLLNKIGLD
jgi:hypothetical protein